MMSDRVALPVEQTVVLRPGIEVPLDILLFRWDLESRGISMRIDRGDLVVRPKRLLTPEDVARLTRQALALKRLLLHGEELTA
jgi:hypothetical protein